MSESPRAWPQSDMTQEQENAHERINQLWNKLARTRATLFAAKKAEDFQSVGMKCRECLLSLAQSLGEAEMVQKDKRHHSVAFLLTGSELIADYCAAGSVMNGYARIGKPSQNQRGN